MLVEFGMEKLGDPHALYEWAPEKREDAMAYLYQREFRAGRLTPVKAKDEAADVVRLFGTDFEGGG